MIVLAIDPGPTDSAWVVWDGSSILSHGKRPNRAILRWIEAGRPAEVCVIEKVASYGMPVGFEVFETVFWSGRFAQAFGGDGNSVHRLTRLAVKQHLCHDSRAKDSNIRQALIDRFGSPGTKKNPGLLYGVHGDAWAGLALGITWWDLNVPKPQ